VTELSHIILGLFWIAMTLVWGGFTLGYILGRMRRNQ
jgi:hypothetical protein